MTAASVEQEQFEACLRTLTGFDRLGGGPELHQQLIYLLQFVTIQTRRTVMTVSPDELRPWLDAARGFSEYDLRVRLLELLRVELGNPALVAAPQSGSSKLRRLLELCLWSRTHRRLHERTQSYFEAITQAEILKAEGRCVPLYRAVHQFAPQRDFSGVFVESDEDVVRTLRELGTPSDPPHITDIGCGMGRLLGRLAREYPGATLSGTSIFDFSPEEQASLSASGIASLYCPADQISLESGSQDIVVSTEVIEHLRDPSRLISEVHRILKPGGIFCITAPSKASYMYCKNPFSYLAVALSSIWAGALPPFHDLYSPLTPIPIVHYGFDPQRYRSLFAESFGEDVRVNTSRFTALKKFRLDGVAPRLPLLKWMGGIVIASGVRS